MKKYLQPIILAFRIWICTVFFATCVVFIGIQFSQIEGLEVFALILFVAMLCSFPAFVMMAMFLPLLKVYRVRNKYSAFITIQLFIAFLYGLLGASFNLMFIFRIRSPDLSFLFSCFTITTVLFIVAFFSTFITRNALFNYLYPESGSTITFTSLVTEIKTKNMDTNQLPASPAQQPNRVFIKGMITAGLILLMNIPAFFIQNLVTEREQRQKEVVKEVSSKWAASQNLSGPYLMIPYTDQAKLTAPNLPNAGFMILLPEQLDVKAKLYPEARLRSIYKVLLYKTQAYFSGNFKVQWSPEINPGDLDFKKARICFNLSDLKGIEEELIIKLGDKSYPLHIGLAASEIGKSGLSAPIDLDESILQTGLSFNLLLKCRGSEQLQFLPLAANSNFQIQSSWPNPSFNGNSLPAMREVKDSGFSAQWNFNQANLPYNTNYVTGTNQISSLAFGVSMVQPADQYNKTMRSVKYAILIIGLTFVLFFIIELMQKKPFHPVQYVLVGFALVIFYSLLLAISEFMLFSWSYLIAATATILLITFYTRNHFKQWKTALLFGTLISCLYGFIYILINLEDTALLIGSIGLFVVLALIMYASRKVNWYTGLPANNIQ
jgi:inner membrane protein